MILRLLGSNCHPPTSAPLLDGNLTVFLSKFQCYLAASPTQVYIRFFISRRFIDWSNFAKKIIQTKLAVPKRFKELLVLLQIKFRLLYKRNIALKPLQGYIFSNWFLRVCGIVFAHHSSHGFVLFSTLSI